MMKNWAGKRYWLVGASEGLGASLAKEMSDRGAELILSARNEEKLAAVAHGLANKATVLPCDVGSQESVDKAISALGKIDGIVFWQPRTGRCQPRAGILKNARKWRMSISLGPAGY